MRSTRRQLLSATATVTVTWAIAGTACARTVQGPLSWTENEAYPASALHPGPWVFFTPTEADAVDAIVSRLIPNDAMGPGAREAGVTTFIDRQLAGPYGGHDWLYMQGPFPPNPLPNQGLQSPIVPRAQYRQGLAALGAYCRANFAGKVFAGLGPDDQDRLISGMEKGELKLEGFSSQMLFNTIYANTMEGFFADPVYGGNQNMAGWKLVGFPGVRYDYRDVLDRPNQPYTMPPVALRGRPAWDGKPA